MTPPRATPTLTGLRVLSFESRRAQEIARLIAAYGGVPALAPAMREVPLESNTEALDFIRGLIDGRFDMLILLTGVGTRTLARIAGTICAPAEFIRALGRVSLVARGPKPAAALKELGAAAAITAPEPSTWRDVLQSLDANAASAPLRGRRVAVQEYGASNPELLAGLARRGAIVTRVPVYEWALPEDSGPLRSAIEDLASGRMDVVLFTSSAQLTNLLHVAAQDGREPALLRCFPSVAVGSIGPMTSEALRARGIEPDFEPPHPKMGFLVNEAAQRAAEVLRRKRAAW